MVSKESSNTQGNETLLKTWPQVFFLYFIGLSLFLIIAFIIVTLRISHKGEVVVPSLIGRTYLEVHNHLQESGFEVKLKSIHSTNYPYGYILSQSLSPGRIVKVGQNISIFVNQSKKIIKTPTLVGSLESVVPKILGNVHSGEQRFELVSGVVTRIPSKKPKGEILAQFPLPETPIFPEYPISYLVSDGVAKGISNKSANLSDKTIDKKGLNGIQKKKAYVKLNQIINELHLKKKMLNIEIVKSISYYLEIPLEIHKVSIKSAEQDGLVLEYSLPNDSELNQESTWKVQVGHYNPKHPEEEVEYPFRFSWVNLSELGLDESGIYTIAQQRGAMSAQDSRNAQELSGLCYANLKKDRAFPVFKTFHDDFLIWNGYHTARGAAATVNTEIEKPIQLYQPESIVP